MIDSKIDPKIEKALLLLENDIDALGWDQPPRLYAVLGDDEDPYLELAFTFPEGHPVDHMRQMVAQGKFSPEVKGCVVATEGWRHPTMEDLQKTDAWEVITRSARSANVPEDQIEEKGRMALEYANSMMRPAENPYRVEIRNVVVVMRDGRVFGVHRDRGSAAEVMEGKIGGRVDSAMQALLTGEWPEGL